MGFACFAMSGRGKSSVPETRGSQIQSSWVPNTPIKSTSSNPRSICTDRDGNGVDYVSTPHSTYSGGVDQGCSNWEAFLRGKPQPDATITSGCGDLNATNNPMNSIFRTGSEGTIFEESFRAPVVENKFISVGQNMWINSNYLSKSPNGDTTSCNNFDLNSPYKVPIDDVSRDNPTNLFAPITPSQSKKTEKGQVCSNQTVHNQLSKTVHAVSSEHSSSPFAPITPDKSKETEKSLACSNSPTDQQISNSASCAAVSTQMEENHNANNDPLSTPEPKPRRKKHRPKVVKEGQAKRGPKPTTPKPEGKTETPTQKRKYVRKIGVDKNMSLPEAAVQGIENKDTPKAKRKYVRKSGIDKTPGLDSEVSSKCIDGKEEPLAQKSCKKRLNFDENSFVVEANSAFGPASNEMEESQSPSQLSQNSELVGNKKSDLVQGVGPEQLNESRKAKCQIVFSDRTLDKQETVVEMMTNSHAETVPTLNYSNCSTCLYEGEDARVLKRAREGTIYGEEQIYTNVYGSHYNSMTKYVEQFPAYAYGDSTHFPTTEFKTQSKRRHGTKETILYTSHNDYMASHVPETNIGYAAVQFCPNKYQNGTQSLLNAHLQQQAFEYRLLMEHARTMRENISNTSAQLCSFSSLVDQVERNHGPYYIADGTKPCGDLQIYQSSHPSNASMEIKVKKTRNPMKNGRKIAAVARKKKPTVDDITEYLKHLHIDPKFKEQNALVIYGGGGTLVPFEGSFNPIKKRRERAKVDLDEETNRVWRLLLENINSEGIDGTDEEKAKWWENERRVFKGRADSFIARMHLVQGDRRFSPWKGSVVDSVVGVFLTQNVSDHASSSAFMSLAAHFPLKTEVSSGSCSKEQEVHILEPGDTIGFSNPKKSPTTFMELLQMAENGKQFQNHESQFDLEFYNQSTFPRPIISSVENVPSHEKSREENSSPNGSEENCASEQSEVTVESKSPDTVQNVLNISFQTELISANVLSKDKKVEMSVGNHGSTAGTSVVTSDLKKGKAGKQKQDPVDWDILRSKAQEKGKKERTADTKDSLDWEAVRRADVAEVAKTFKARGMSNILAERIQAFLNRIATEHGSVDLEWLRDVPPDKAKEYLLSIRGLGLKSVECVRLLTLHHLAFPVDTNVGRIAVRLGWVPLQPLPESLQLHLLELYPVLESIQQYLWPRLCKLDQRTLYELHYQLITFGKVFCTKSKPNCNACPMRGECRHFASAFASARLALPGPEEKRIVNATENEEAKQSPNKPIDQLMLPEPCPNQELQAQPRVHIWSSMPIVEEPIVEIPSTPEPEIQVPETDMEDMFLEDPEEIPTIRLNLEKFTQNLQSYMEHNMELQEGDVSKALVAISQEAASIPMPKLKNVNSLRTEHQVYELPDTHPLLKGMDRREPDDPCSYLLAIWTPGETANSFEQPENRCSSQESGKLCEVETCFSCNSVREANSQIVRGTLLIPCRTANKGSFPLNGTYFQVNEVFADHETSLKPIDVPRSWIWNLPRRTVYFGTSIPTIFKGLSTEDIQYCFWRGFVCVRGFDQKTRAPRPLMARLHFPVSKLPKTSNKTDEKKA